MVSVTNGPNSSVSGQSISSARVSIYGYVSGTDELVIDGITKHFDRRAKKYLNFAVSYNGTNYDNIDAIFFINQGVMEITIPTQMALQSHHAGQRHGPVVQ